MLAPVVGRLGAPASSSCSRRSLAASWLRRCLASRRPRRTPTSRPALPPPALLRHSRKRSVLTDLTGGPQSGQEEIMPRRLGRPASWISSISVWRSSSPMSGGVLVSVKSRLRTVVCCLALQVGAMTGVPMRPDEIQELMHTLAQPKLARTNPDRPDDGDVAAGGGRRGCAHQAWVEASGPGRLAAPSRPCARRHAGGGAGDSSDRRAVPPPLQSRACHAPPVSCCRCWSSRLPRTPRCLTGRRSKRGAEDPAGLRAHQHLESAGRRDEGGRLPAGAAQARRHRASRATSPGPGARSCWRG